MPPASPEAAQQAPARPFLKWAGGKGRLLPELLARIPGEFGAYHEPFLGGGALFFELAGRKRLQRALLSDASPALIDTYVALKTNVARVITLLAEHRNEREYFYGVRNLDPAKLALTARAARMIYLNKTCYNGLYRENKAGRFNVPFGRYANPRICDAENLRAVSRTLRQADVERRGYASVLERAVAGDLVYLDPPYHPLSATSSFTSYHRQGFGEEEQKTLRRVFGELAGRGVFVLLSNSDTAFVGELYAGFPADRVHVSRAINSRGAGRGRVAELIVRGW